MVSWLGNIMIIYDRLHDYLWLISWLSMIDIMLICDWYPDYLWSMSRLHHDYLWSIAWLSMVNIVIICDRYHNHLWSISWFFVINTTMGSEATRVSNVHLNWSWNMIDPCAAACKIESTYPLLFERKGEDSHSRGWPSQKWSDLVKVGQSWIKLSGSSDQNGRCNSVLGGRQPPLLAAPPQSFKWTSEQLFTEFTPSATVQLPAYKWWNLQRILAIFVQSSTLQWLICWFSSCIVDQGKIPGKVAQQMCMYSERTRNSIATVPFSPLCVLWFLLV